MSDHPKETGLRLVQHPIEELDELRTTREPRAVAKTGELPPSADIELEVVPGEWKEAGLRLSNSAGEEVTIGVSSAPLELFVDRRKSRRTPLTRPIRAGTRARCAGAAIAAHGSEHRPRDPRGLR